MRIFKTAWFTRFARKNGIDDTTLNTLVQELGAGLFEAELGAGLYKKRIARPGQGKAGGFRTIICFRQQDRAFFIYGFSKSDKDNITASHLTKLKKFAELLLKMDLGSINEQAENFIEIGEHDENLQG